MALEEVFECSRTLRRLRTYPFEKVLEGFCNWLLKHGFSRWAIRKHLFNVSHLNEYLSRPKTGVCEGVSPRIYKGEINRYRYPFWDRRIWGFSSV